MTQTLDYITHLPHAVRLLRCQKTGRYFTGNGWTHDPGQAEVFPDEIAAARACVSQDLHDVELVLRTEATGAEIFSTTVR